MKIGERDVIKNCCSCLEIGIYFHFQNKSVEFDWSCY